ncbi:MAG: hypothetical protein LBD58_03015 [Treponema sp.]|nr:hypothetical protein [Treponema sp.]
MIDGIPQLVLRGGWLTINITTWTPRWNGRWKSPGDFIKRARLRCSGRFAAYTTIGKEL